MDTRRKRILLNIQELMNKIPEIRYTEVNRMSVIDIDMVPLPCVFVSSGPSQFLEDKRATIGYENYEWVINLEVWAQKMDMEDMLGKIQTILFSDYSFGGEAVKSWNTSVEFWIVDPARDLSAMLIAYTLIYRHPLGDPYG